MGELQGIIFGEFDDKLGPKLSFQYPGNLISGDRFSSVSDYFITDQELCHRCSYVYAFDLVFVGYPVRIESKNYSRNYLLFNVILVLEKPETILPYENIVKKLGEALKAIELESEFVSRKENRGNLYRILENIFRDLNVNSECTVAFDIANVVTLKILRFPMSPDLVEDHHVPIIVKDLSEFPINQWDLTIQRVLPFINGVNYVKKIALLSEVDLELVRISLRQLLYIKCIQTIDIFQFSNIYEIKDPSNLHRLYVDQAFQKQCIRYCCPENENRAISVQDYESIYMDAIIVILSEFSQRKSVTEVVKIKEKIIGAKLKVNLRDLIVFSVVNSILRRVHKFPVLASPISTTSPDLESARKSMESTSRFRRNLQGIAPNTASNRWSPSALVTNSRHAALPRTMGIRGLSPLSHSYDLERVLNLDDQELIVSLDSQMQARLVSLLDGTNCMDKICCILEKSASEVVSILSGIPNCVIVTR